MKIKIPVGFIGGGNMAEAMIQGLLASKTIIPSACWVSDIIDERLSYLKKTYGIKAVSDTPQVIRSSQAIILAVKPQNVDQALSALSPVWTSDKILISIAAGVPTVYLSRFFAKAPKIIRVMPNTPALVQQGASALARGHYASDADMELALKLFRAVGKAVEVEEKWMDAVTGLSGSGPAYILLLLESLIDAGVLEGLPRATARELVIQTALGTAAMLAQSAKHPGELKDMITSPGGTTIHGLQILEERGVRGALMAAVGAATRRSKELGKK